MSFYYVSFYYVSFYYVSFYYGFRDLEEVRSHAEKWRITYNTVKRHGSLNKQTPEQFAAQCRLRSATPPFAGIEPKPTETLVGLT
ncbi:transposase [Haloferula rosea]|uniref:Transposase n=1 Tax=Haloferula rosea TaxID=490093 RepID=A0A934RGK8_9BACT|nr:transposase [Haloferula rosea]